MGLSYTWCNSKPLDLSKSNSQKKALINANIPTSISLIVPCLLHSIRISKPKKRKHLILSLSLSLSTFGVQAFVSSFVSVCCSSTIVPSCRQRKKKKKKPIALTCSECFVSIVSTSRIKAPSLWVLCFYFSFLFCCECSVFFFFFWNTVNGSQRIMWQHRFVRTQNTYSI